LTIGAPFIASPRHLTAGWRAGVLSALCVAASALLTALVLAGAIGLSYRNAAAHLVLETADAGVALLVAYLLYGRFVRSRRLQDLLLLQGLLLLATAGFGTTLLLLSTLGDREAPVDVWLPLVVRVTGVLFVTAAAVVGTQPLVNARWRRWTLAPVVLVVTTASLSLSAATSFLPVALDPGISPNDRQPLLSGHPMLVGAQLLTVACFFVAAYLFVGQAGRGSDQLVRWLGPAFVLAAFARLNYALFPSLYSQWLYTGDVLRTGFFVLLLVGAAREIRAYWAAQAQAAVLEDRRRLARELHDGVVQELGYIRAESRSLRTLDPPRTERIVGACDRALDEARQAVEAMGSIEHEPLGLTLHRAARQVADRYDVALELDLDDTITAEPARRHALMRIVREAVANSARHGGARHVRMELGREEYACHLRIADDGSGFDPARALNRKTGFGLTSMRERAEALPASFSLESQPGHGTTVLVRWQP
jgi:signal transduction histidine kinase